MPNIEEQYFTLVGSGCHNVFNACIYPIEEVWVDFWSCSYGYCPIGGSVAPSVALTRRTHLDFSFLSSCYLLIIVSLLSIYLVFLIRFCFKALYNLICFCACVFPPVSFYIFSPPHLIHLPHVLPVYFIPAYFSLLLPGFVA